MKRYEKLITIKIQEKDLWNFIMKLSTCLLFSFHLEPSNHLQHAMRPVIPISQRLDLGKGRVPVDCLPSQQESSKPWAGVEHPSLGFPAAVSGQCCLLLAPHMHACNPHRCNHWKEGTPLSKNGLLRPTLHLDFRLLGLHPVPASKELGAQINIVYNFSAWQTHRQQTGTLCASAERNNPAPLKIISSLT